MLRITILYIPLLVYQARFLIYGFLLESSFRKIGILYSEQFVHHSGQGIRELTAS